MASLNIKGPSLPRRLGGQPQHQWTITLSKSRCDELCQGLKSLGPRVAMAVVKSWANAWTTSSRMHDELRLPCIFGCEGCMDSLDHYLYCDPLWSAVISCSFRRTELLLADPITRLGLGGSKEWWQMLSVAFSCYHALKLGHREDIVASLVSGHLCQVHGRLLSYARVFASDVISSHT